MNDRIDSDNYPTPHWCYKALRDFLVWRDDVHCLEPCCGDWRIASWLTNYYTQIYSNVNAFDIRGTPSVDYLQWQPLQRYHLIVTNPPYRKAFQFVRKAVREADCVVMLLKLDFLGSGRRAEWLRDNTPTGLYVLADRPSFTPDGQTDMHNYAWFVWDRGENKLTKDGMHWIRKPTTKKEEKNENQ